MSDSLSFIGNLTRDPELRHTGAGVPVVTLRLARTPRRYDRAAGTYVDGEPVYLDATVWRDAACNAADTLHRGDRVVVLGQLRQRTYTAGDGTSRTVVDIEADTVAVDLRFVVCEVRRTRRGDADQADRSDLGRQDQPGRLERDATVAPAALGAGPADPFGAAPVGEPAEVAA